VYKKFKRSWLIAFVHGKKLNIFAFSFLYCVLSLSTVNKTFLFCIEKSYLSKNKGSFSQKKKKKKTDPLREI